jgi:bifunctional non-homologous end joining protein LigD
MKTTLYYKDGSSDKVYSCEIQELNDKCTVNFAYGRRGSTMQTGTKTNKPVSREEAEKIYNKLIREKTAKGYTPGEDGAKYTNTEFAKQVSGVEVQTLNFIEKDEVQRLIFDDRYCAQEKFDGERMTLSKKNGTVTAGNKLGLQRGFPTCLEETLEYDTHIVLDGEIVGEIYHVFDLLEFEDRDLRDWSYESRLAALEGEELDESGLGIVTVETAYTSKDKKALFDRLKKEGREGIVFKLLSAKYTSGRPASGGSQLKFKIYATASCRVSGVNQKRSVKLAVLDLGKWIEIGNVTIPPNRDIPVDDQIVEVRYLYAYKGGSLFQPAYIGLRNDVALNECTIDQLKYKNT